MATVKINNKTYQVPELSFAHSRRMEQMGLPVEGLIDRKYIFTAVSAFTAVVANCDAEQADYLVEQHIRGGGTREDIYKAYAESVPSSGFFKKLLGLDKAEEKPKNTKKSTLQKTEQKSLESGE